MLLEISKLSKFSKKQWVFKYKNENFDDILVSILKKLKYDYIELTIYSFEVYLFKEIDYKRIANNPKFSTLMLSKNSSIEFTNPKIFDEIRLFEMNIFCNDEKLFNIKSDNYGEYTSIDMAKTISEERLLKMLEDISQ